MTLQYACSIRNPDGTDSPLEEAPDPITFEVGAGDFMGNALFQAFDEAVMGLSAGAEATVEAQRHVAAHLPWTAHRQIGPKVSLCDSNDLELF